MAVKKKAKKKPVKKVVRKKIVAKKAKKPVIKKRAVIKKAKVVKKTKAIKKPKISIDGTLVGVVTHYFPKVMAAVVKMKGILTAGDKIKIKGHTTDFTQTVSSIQMDRVAINTAKKGQEIGILVTSRVREDDLVYKI